MVSITVSIPEDIRKKMKEFPEINWSAIVRKTLIERISQLSLREEMLKKLKGEKELIAWSVELGRKAKKGRMQKINADNN